MKLFTPYSINKMKVKNRIVMAPMETGYGCKHGHFSLAHFKYFEKMAKGGVGMILTEAVCVHPTGRYSYRQPMLYEDSSIESLSKLAKLVKEYGCLFGVQLHHAGRQANPKYVEKVLGPSSIPCPVTKEKTHELDHKELEEIKNAFVSAAKRAMISGADFVEFHGAHGYLLAQFLSPASNQREDEYGGTIENRVRLCKEIVEKTRDIVGPDFPLIFRISGDEFISGGLTNDEAIEAAKMLQTSGIDAFHISAGVVRQSSNRILPDSQSKEAPNVYLSARFKKALKVPIITVGKIWHPETAENIIKSEKADFVAFGRTLLADPDWPNKVVNKRSDLRYCIWCDTCDYHFCGCPVGVLRMPETNQVLYIRESPKKMQIVPR